MRSNITRRSLKGRDVTRIVEKGAEGRETLEQELENLGRLYVGFEVGNKELLRSISKKTKKYYPTLIASNKREAIEKRIRLFYFGAWLCHNRLGLGEKLAVYLPDFQF